jgi:hypothetical protein
VLRIPTPTSFAPRTKLYSTIAIFLFALLAVYQVSQFVPALGLILIGFVGLAFAIRILNDWRASTSATTFLCSWRPALAN